MTGPDRDDLDREDRIATLLRRRAQGVHIPSFTVVEARLARRTPVPLVVLSAAAIVVVALVVGGLLSERRSRVAEPQVTPPLTSASPATTAPASTPAAASVLSDRFGFVWATQRGSSGVQIQAETGQGGFELPTSAWRFSACSCAVSPDGTRVAYWAGITPGAIELRVVDVARAGLGTTIYKAPADRRGAALAWSSDGNGILFSLEDWGSPGGPPSGPTGTSLLMIEATGGTARTLATGDGAYVPLGWDRAAEIAAAALSGEGGYMGGYLTVRTSGDPAPQRTAIAEDIFVLSLDVSTDQRFVLGLFSDRSGGSVVRWWRLGDFRTIVGSGPRVDHAAGPKWRPFTSEIGWIEGDSLQLLDVERGRGRVAGTFPSARNDVISFRWDGSAVVAGSVLLEIASGRSETIASAGSIAGAVRFTAAPSPPSSPDYTPPPLNELEMKVIDALGKLGITGQRAQLPFRDASMWANFGTGSHLFVNAYPLGTVDRDYTVIEERQLAGIAVQDVRRGTGSVSTRFECSGDEYWVAGALPPGFANMDAFIERFISALACSP
jgi:hypothetical protein